ncbi:7-carboxy-7-deazaguanine synthase QueE [Dendrosporobacter sp. 1207_IL3150]|uniref:7-carboxy-7-deazaguanine synthase QueE n=1 Tax=Dendrosporobacter sp. 1207_IL3150 TaxID=3084054 RepID=UPI002FDADEE6
MVDFINMVEVFSSIQGEGQYVGCRQVFVRLAGCNLQCIYCDTPTSRAISDSCRIEQTPGKRDFFIFDNPFMLSELVNKINNLLVHPHHSVSFTGGEPLCQADALNQVISGIKGKIYIETNGTLPKELKKIINNIDIVSMDIKMPDVTGSELWDVHKEFLKIAADKEVFVKLVVTGTTQKQFFEKAVELVTSVNRKIPLILQPVTPINGCIPILPEEVLELQSLALKSLDIVKVIPQTHKFIDQL